MSMPQTPRLIRCASVLVCNAPKNSLTAGIDNPLREKQQLSVVHEMLKARLQNKEKGTLVSTIKSQSELESESENLHI